MWSCLFMCKCVILCICSRNLLILSHLIFVLTSSFFFFSISLPLSFASLACVFCLTPACAPRAAPPNHRGARPPHYSHQTRGPQPPKTEFVPLTITSCPPLPPTGAPSRPTSWRTTSASKTSSSSSKTKSANAMTPYLPMRKLK